MTQDRKIRYAVVGLGWIAQESVLPAFANAPNSELVALVSDDSAKLKKLGKKHRVKALYSYEEFDTCLRSGIDVVYLALSEGRRKFAARAKKAGIRVFMRDSSHTPLTFAHAAAA